MLKYNYDKENDLLYIRYADSGPSYGEEDDNGIVTFFDMSSDKITGATIFDFKEKLKSGFFKTAKLPLRIKPDNSRILKLIG